VNPLEFKLIGGLVAAIALFGGGVWAYHAVHEDGKAEGIAETTVQWKAQLEAQTAAAAKEAAANAALLAEANRNNQETHDALEAKIAAADADRVKFAGRLSNALSALAAANSSSAPCFQGGSGSAQASGPTCAQLLERLSQRIASAQSECVLNDNRLDALVIEVAPQANRP
jgi:hypothetical protein